MARTHVTIGEADGEQPCRLDSGVLPSTLGFHLLVSSGSPQLISISLDAFVIDLPYMKTDRLRILVIGVIAIIAIELGYEIFGQSERRSGFVMTLIFMAVALERIRLELRDIREEILKSRSNPETLSTRNI